MKPIELPAAELICGECPHSAGEHMDQKTPAWSCTRCACRAFAMAHKERSDLEERIDDLRSQLDVAEMSFLAGRGWCETSATPDFAVRWVKTLDNGTTIMTNKADALRMEGIT